MEFLSNQRWAGLRWFGLSAIIVQLIIVVLFYYNEVQASLTDQCKAEMRYVAQNMNGGLYDAYDPTRLTHLGAHFVHYTTGQLDNTNLVGGSRQIFLPIVFPLAPVFPERPEGLNRLTSDYGEHGNVSLFPAAYGSGTHALARR